MMACCDGITSNFNWLFAYLILYAFFDEPRASNARDYLSNIELALVHKYTTTPSAIPDAIPSSSSRFVNTGHTRVNE